MPIKLPCLVLQGSNNMTNCEYFCRAVYMHGGANIHNMQYKMMVKYSIIVCSFDFYSCLPLSGIVRVLRLYVCVCIPGV